MVFWLMVDLFQAGFYMFAREKLYLGIIGGPCPSSTPVWLYNNSHVGKMPNAHP
jgi:hypothetical protein